MRPPTALALAALALFTPFTLHAQQPDYARVGTPIPTDPADPAITAALQNISADHIRATIEHLVSFGTRNTLSSTEPNLPQAPAPPPPATGFTPSSPPSPKPATTASTSTTTPSPTPRPPAKHPSNPASAAPPPSTTSTPSSAAPIPPRPSA